ncbi:MAG: type I-E CRISPR-associated protein Cas6/Cse3/CasE [Hyphomicrobiaceae bacterium]|nr:type I-E CRISPR-associated protein Cas6/Cse3/CasE [Hyphomicrobiaceae bacterium]
MWHDNPFLTRLRLKRDSAVVAPLIRNLLPKDEKEAGDMHHRLLWTLFADEGATPASPPVDGASRAAFLWRHMDAAGTFLVLGPRPAPASPYFEIETKPFDVDFCEGQRLAFDLRLNATVDRMVESGKGRAGRHRSDIVLDALHALRREGMNEKGSGPLRLSAAQAAVSAWLARRGSQGGKGGFHLEECTVTAYRTVTVGGGRKASQQGISDAVGVLSVTDPAVFRTMLLSGLGRRKAFGCGLMLVRPAV